MGAPNDPPKKAESTIDHADLVAQLKRLNANIERDIHTRSSWKLALRNGLVTAAGSVVGTAIALAILVRILQPLGQLTSLRPVLERLASEQPSSGKAR